MHFGTRRPRRWWQGLPIGLAILVGIWSGHTLWHGEPWMTGLRNGLITCCLFLVVYYGSMAWRGTSGPPVAPPTRRS